MKGRIAVFLFSEGDKKLKIMEKVPYMLVVGEKEVEGNSFAIRRRGEGEIGSMSVEDFTAMVLKENAEKVIF